MFFFVVFLVAGIVAMAIFWKGTSRWSLFRLTFQAKVGEGSDHQKFQVPKMQVFETSKAIWVGGFSLIHTVYMGEYLHFRYLKCLVTWNQENLMALGEVGWKIHLILMGNLPAMTASLPLHTTKKLPLDHH